MCLATLPVDAGRILAECDGLGNKRAVGYSVQTYIAIRSGKHRFQQK